MDNYIIVGRKIDHGETRYLHGDGSINLDAQKDGKAGAPLTVEFIGKKVVELSQKPPLIPGTEEYRQVTEQIRNALVVKGPDLHDPNDTELDKILDKVSVELMYDTREKVEGQQDKNTRTLVIPVKDTLAYREQYFQDKEPNPGFEPPLTYALDRMMMKLYFNRLIKEVVTEFVDEDGKHLSRAIQSGLEKSVDDKLGSYAALVADAEDETEKSMAKILDTPVSAFHRAVGIYITNMCD